MSLTRAQLLAALGGAGLYGLVDGVAPAPERTARRRRRAEQHVLAGLQVVRDDGIEVVVPPLHHQVVTARLRVGVSARELRAARAELEATLVRLERRFAPSPAGLGITVAWGLPYFRRLVARQWAVHGPLDRRARKPALLDAIRFPSDPAETILERNDLAVLLRSDVQAHVAAGATAIFGELDGLFRVTSVRKGFAGGGFAGKRSLPKTMAVAVGVPGADLIPETAELFLGFTSTQRAGLGPPRIANLETLGYADLRSGYFRGGTAMHLSHLFEDLEAWYLNFDFAERVSTSFRPGLRVRAGAQTVRQDPEDTTALGGVKGIYRRTGAIGHSSALQTSSRLQEDVRGTDGVLYRRGTAVPQRADFNTLDNPFAFSASPARDGEGDGARAGLHFVVFNPTSDDFHRNRLAMDGILPDRTKLPFEPRSRGQGFNAVLRTTHRQNFLVPPRRHRSFPLVDLL